MNFRPAKPEETSAVLDLYHSVQGTPFCTWNNDYPGIFEIDRDMNSGDLFVLTENDRIIGAISVDPENELDDLPFWTVRKNAAEIGRVVIHPDLQGKGLASLLVESIQNELRKRGCRAIHLLVAVINLPAYRTYRKLGFSVLGETTQWGIDFYVCEKAL